VSGPKAVIRMKPGAKTDVDSMVLTGRSTITDKQRQVTADVITVKTNPKAFDAQGNVKTSFIASKGSSGSGLGIGSSGGSAAGAKGASKPSAKLGAKTAPAAAPKKPTVLTEEQELGL
jgi:hypothetical protein